MSEEIRQYKYDAFISYRHSELDKFVAENLHTQMEAFKLPGNVKRSGVTTRKKIERVFRDQEELPLANNLEDPIVQALKDSEYLIVICSPRLKESMWCRREIETFAQIHGREKMLAVLVEGEPGESFPPELLYYDEMVQQYDGRIEKVRRHVDPLAADVRGRDKKEILKAMEIEKLRLLAPMFGVGFDDLRQRHRERKMRKIITLVSVIAAVLLLFAGVSLFAALRINKQKETIEDQAVEIGAQLEEISAQAEEIEKQNEKLQAMQAVNLAEKSEQYYSGDQRWLAIDTAAKALTEYEGVKMPYTEDAQYALSKALHLYNNGRTLKADWQINTSAGVDDMVSSDSGRYLAIMDHGLNLYLWDVVERKNLFQSSLTVTGKSGSIAPYAFIGDEKFIFVNRDRMLCVYDIVTGKCDEIEKAVSSYFALDEKHERIYWFDFRNVDGVTKDILDCFDLNQKTHSEAVLDKRTASSSMVYDDATNTLIYQARNNDPNENSSWLVLVDADTLEEKTVQILPEVGTISEAALDGAYVYLATTFADLLTDENGDTNFVYETNFYKVDTLAGDVLWSQNFDMTTVGDMFLGADENTLYFTATGDIYKMNAQTGEVVDVAAAISNTLVGRTKVFASNNFYIFTGEGEVGYVNFDAGNVFIDPTNLYVGMPRINKVLAMDGSYAMCSNRDNRVVFYASAYDPSLIENTELIDTDAIDSTECYKYTEAKRLAGDYGITSAEMVECIFYNEDKSMMFVAYSLDELEIYQTKGEKCKLLATIDVSDLGTKAERYVGTDQYGNIYIAGSLIASGNGLCLSKDTYKPLAYIEGLIAVEKDHLILKDSYDNQYTTSIYTVEDMLTMVKEGDFQPE
ncbi:MAG: toll/interleukin-1 receptor domain-containing protein [Lachnospiraceae bacterium]|nr:toll/interleukin-1 receptor domain-containing protein [Lachnospiraceae bacterium]